jgi:ABC-type uncharacterized transport system permease subunit
MDGSDRPAATAAVVPAALAFLVALGRDAIGMVTLRSQGSGARRTFEFTRK